MAIREPPTKSLTAKFLPGTKAFCRISTRITFSQSKTMARVGLLLRMTRIRRTVPIMLKMECRMSMVTIHVAKLGSKVLKSEESITPEIIYDIYWFLVDFHRLFMFFEIWVFGNHHEKINKNSNFENHEKTTKKSSTARKSPKKKFSQMSTNFQLMYSPVHLWKKNKKQIYCCITINCNGQESQTLPHQHSSNVDSIADVKKND